MIRFLQTPGPTKKIVLGGLLLIICAAMVITLVPGGIGSGWGLNNTPGAGVYATIAGQKVESLDVQKMARQMIQQQFPQNAGQATMLMPFIVPRAADTLITGKILV